MIKDGQLSLVLTDNDIISKLAHWRLLDSLTSAFNCSVNQIYTLPSLVIRARKAIANPDKLFRDTETASYAYDFLKQLSVQVTPNPQTVAELQQNPNIDYGEALLIAIALTENKSLIATGDKRAIASIGSLQAQGQLLELRGRIVCLEQLLNCFTQVLSFSFVQNCIKKLPDIDRATKAIWGSRIDSPEAAVYEGMSSYINSLKSSAPALLIE